VSQLRAKTPGLVVLVTAAVAAGLVSAFYLAGEHSAARRPAGSAPTTQAMDQPHAVGSMFRCPDEFPVRAFADHRSYPPGHPGNPPLTARPLRCYATAAKAAAAGYPVAPLPPGTSAIGDLYLAPVDKALGDRCQQAANRLGFAVPCPRLLPTESSPPPGSFTCDQPSCVSGGRFILDENGSFLVPPGYVGVEGRPQGHLVIVGAARQTDESVRCFGERRIGQPRIHGVPAVLAECQPASELHGGHVLVRWREQGTVVVVSLHGQSVLNQRLVVAIAAALRLLRPTR
jgi:hypothetical protein